MRPIEIWRMHFKAFYNARRRGFILALHLWSNGPDLTVTIFINAINQSHWSLMKCSIGRLRPKSLKIEMFFHIFMYSWMISLNWSVYTHLSLKLFLIISSRLISASTKWLKGRFRRSIKEDLTLEHRRSFSKLWNEKPWIWQLIGSFRSLS